MKKLFKIMLITFMVMSLFVSPVFAQEENNPPDFAETLYNRIINKVSAFVATNSAETKKAIDEKAAAVENAIKNYNDKFINDISTALTQYRLSITNDKLQALEAMMNEYVSTMEEEKPQIIDNLKQQLEQEVDEDFAKAVDRLLKNLK